MINRIYIASHGAFSLGSQLLAPNFRMARRTQSGNQNDQSERAQPTCQRSRPQRSSHGTSRCRSLSPRRRRPAHPARPALAPAPRRPPRRPPIVPPAPATAVVIRVGDFIRITSRLVTEARRLDARPSPLTRRRATPRTASFPRSAREARRGRSYTPTSGPASSAKSEPSPSPTRRISWREARRSPT